jgi:ParB/RepB/Spo0J family partition protein
MTQESANRELVMLNPHEILMVTQAHLDKYPEQRHLLEPFYDVRAERPNDPDFVETIRQVGYIHTPIFVVHSDELEKDVLVAGRRRLKAALALGLEQIPAIFHSDEAKLNVAIELTENISRSENTAVESAYAFRKAMKAGYSQKEIAVMCGITDAEVSHILSLGDMPKVVHDWIKKGRLSETAALSLKKTVGKPAPKGAGITAIYDEKEVKAHLEGLSDQVRLSGGSKIKTKHTQSARKSGSANPDAFTPKDWRAVVADASTPPIFVPLISLFLGDLSLTQARQQGLDWLKKPIHQPKPKKIKEAKTKNDKKKKQDVVTVTPEQSSQSLKELFGTA